MTSKDDDSDLGETLRSPCGADLEHDGVLIGRFVKLALLLAIMIRFYQRLHLPTSRSYVRITVYNTRLTKIPYKFVIIIVLQIPHTSHILLGQGIRGHKRLDLD